MPGDQVVKFRSPEDKLKEIQEMAEDSHESLDLISSG